MASPIKIRFMVSLLGDRSGPGGGVAVVLHHIPEAGRNSQPDPELGAVFHFHVHGVSRKTSHRFTSMFNYR